MREAIGKALYLDELAPHPLDIDVGFRRAVDPPGQVQLRFVDGLFDPADSAARDEHPCTRLDLREPRVLAPVLESRAEELPCRLTRTIGHNQPPCADPHL
ncbi:MULTISPECIES: hypothetical protein [Streptomyces]|uniref:Uncharacterized protein n=1 Tax=Streptomyces edwardsiae TaxID=3075527 RepID=A0ABU2PPR2_9ACTN|nr:MULTISPECIES: hypothetical protein [unclassified Streptomyces]MDT0393796.1 hypothetical protein [Streptomyces sp. DSM 41636]